ncbi:MAG: hypothetical protein IRZ18_00170 [Clostridia bacterium]|nr:hypothetical protein [Clostridia bacterium]
MDPREFIPGGPPQYLARSVMASFADPRAAQAAARELREQGYTVDVVQVSGAPVDRSDLRQPRDEAFPRTLLEEPAANAVASQESDDAGLRSAAATPAGRLGRAVWRVTVPVADDDMRRRVEDVVRRHGGEV